jgi:hypothetical protein
MVGSRMHLGRLRHESMTLEPERAWAQIMTARLPEALGLDRLTHGSRMSRVLTWELLSDPDRRR